MQETATARHHTAPHGTIRQWTVHMAWMEESGATVPTRTAQDTFEEKIPNKMFGSAVRLERPQRSI